MPIVKAAGVHADPRPPGKVSVGKIDSLRWNNLRETSTHSFGPSAGLYDCGDSFSVPYDPADDTLAISIDACLGVEGPGLTSCRYCSFGR